MIDRVPPVVHKPTPEAAVYSLNWLTATGSGILLAAVISGLIMGFTPWRMAHVYWKTIVRVRSRCSRSRPCSPLATSPAIRASTPRWALPSPAPACSIRFSARCWDGWG